MKDHNMRQESIKILEENTGSNLFDIGHSNFFQDKVCKGKGNKSENEVLGLHQDQKLLHSKGNSKQNKETTHRIGNKFANDTTDKGLISKIYKELLKLNTHKTDNHIKKRAEDMNRHFSKEDIQMANRHMKKCSSSLAIREIQIKTILRYHLTPVIMAKINKTVNNKCWRGCGENTVGGNAS